MVVRTTKSVIQNSGCLWEKWLWSKQGENDNMPLSQKLILLLWFGGDCYFEEVAAVMCNLPAGHHHIYWEEIHIISFTDTTRHLPENSRTVCAKTHTLNDISPEFLLIAFKCIIGLLNSSLGADLQTTTYQRKAASCGTTSVASANAFSVKNSFLPHNYHNSWILSLSVCLRLQHISSRAPNVPRENVGEKNPSTLKWIHTDTWWKNMKIIFSPRQELHFQPLLQILRECLQNTFKRLCWENKSHLLDTKPRDSTEVLWHIIILISISFLYSRGNNSLPYSPTLLSWSSCSSPFCEYWTSLFFWIP